MSDYRDRLVRAMQELNTLILRLPVNTTSAGTHEHDRLRGKIEGVRLALSYYDETHPPSQRRADPYGKDADWTFG